MRWWAEIHAPTVLEIDCWPLRWPEAWRRRCGHAQRGYCRLRRFLHSRARDRKVNIAIVNQLNSLSEAAYFSVRRPSRDRLRPSFQT